MSHRRNDDGGFAMHNRPSPWCRARRCSDAIGHDLEMRVPKMPVTRDRFPSLAIAHEIVLLHAGNCSGRRPERQTAEFAVSLVEQFVPTHDLCGDILRRGRANRPPLRK